MAACQPFFTLASPHCNDVPRSAASICGAFSGADLMPKSQKIAIVVTALCFLAV
jgi:hypothetical protein